MVELRRLPTPLAKRVWNSKAWNSSSQIVKISATRTDLLSGNKQESKENISTQHVGLAACKEMPDRGEFR